LSRDEVKALLEAPSDLHHRAMLAILYGSGLRVSEVADLKVADIDSGRNVLGLVPAKGGKTGSRCCRRSCANSSEATGDAGGLRSGFFPALVEASRSQ
jgi:site-specific recombinase XerD